MTCFYEYIDFHGVHFFTNLFSSYKVELFLSLPLFLFLWLIYFFLCKLH